MSFQAIPRLVSPRNFPIVCLPQNILCTALLPPSVLSDSDEQWDIFVVSQLRDSWRLLVIRGAVFTALWCVLARFPSRSFCSLMNENASVVAADSFCDDEWNFNPQPRVNLIIEFTYLTFFVSFIFLSGQSNLDPSGMLDTHTQAQHQMQPQPPYRSVSQLQHNVPMSPTGMMPSGINQNSYGPPGTHDGDTMNPQSLMTSNNPILSGPSAG